MSNELYYAPSVGRFGSNAIIRSCREVSGSEGLVTRKLHQTKNTIDVNIYKVSQVITHMGAYAPLVTSRKVCTLLTMIGKCLDFRRLLESY
jgi:hypothetical protein